MENLNKAKLSQMSSEAKSKGAELLLLCSMERVDALARVIGMHMLIGTIVKMSELNIENCQFRSIPEIGNLEKLDKELSETLNPVLEILELTDYIGKEAFLDIAALMTNHTIAEKAKVDAESEIEEISESVKIVTVLSEMMGL